MDDYLDIGGFVDYFIMPEIKLNIGNFTLGVEYSRKNELKDYYSTPDRYYHYFGLSLGGNFKVSRNWIQQFVDRNLKSFYP